MCVCVCVCKLLHFISNCLDIHPMIFAACAMTHWSIELSKWRILDYSQLLFPADRLCKPYFGRHPLVSAGYFGYLICGILASCMTMARGKWHLEDFDCVQHSSLVDWTSLGHWSWQLGSERCLHVPSYFFGWYLIKHAAYSIDIYTSLHIVLYNMHIF